MPDFILRGSMPSESTEGNDNMPNEISDLAALAGKIEATEIPIHAPGIEILPVSHDQFQARWSLSQKALDEGRQIASHQAEGAHLVLRAFSLPSDASNGQLSSVWHDYNIEGTDNSGYFSLPGPAEKINASLGLINQDGRFSPLLRGQSVALPASPASPEIAVAPPAEPEAELPTEETEPEGTPTPRPAPLEVLNEAEICARLAELDGLPEEFKAPASEYLAQVVVNTEVPTDEDTEVPTDEPILNAFAVLPETPVLDEGAVLEAVRHNMAAEPTPEIEESVEQPALHANSEASASETSNDSPSGASEQLASQWEDIWSDKAPIEIRAEFVLTGKIGSGMQLLLGNEIIAPTPGGFFTWKRPLESFDQAWPLLQAALSTPVVPAGPSLEFFKDVAPTERLLELHGALEIEGRISDPDYIERIPPDLSPDAEGNFKLSRMLPDGAVILPGLSLIAGS